MVRVLIPPLTIALLLVTATTLLHTAAEIVSPPLAFTQALRSPRAAAISSPASPIATDAPLLTTGTDVLVRSEPAVLPPPPVVVDLARLTYAPGNGGTSQALPGVLLLAIESGVLTVHLDGAGQLFQSDRAPRRVVGARSLSTGDGLLLPAATAAAFANEGSVPVVALAVGIFPPEMGQRPTGIGSAQGHAAARRWVDDASPGASAQPLAGGWLVDASTGPAVIELRRLSLESNQAAPLSSSGALVLAVEAGTLTLEVEQALAWQQAPNGPDDWIAPASQATLLAGDGALLQDRPQVTLRNDSSAPLLIVALVVAPAGERVDSSG